MRQEEGAFNALRDKAAEKQTSPSMGHRRRRLEVDPTVDPYAMPLAEFNVANPVLFQQDVHWRYFERLRNEAPVHFCPESQYGPYWSITRYADIMEVDANHADFSSDHSFGGVTIMGRPNSDGSLPMFIQMDPPRHDVQRKAVAPKFAGRSLAELEATIRERVEEILDGLPRGETFDWVQRVAVNLTGQMLCTLFGLPVEERHRLIRWSNIFSNADNPDVVGNVSEFYEAMAEAGEYFAELWNARVNAPPTGDLISMLAHGPETRHMTPRELLGNVVLLVVGGNDTTRNSISGGLLALNEHPDQYAKLLANPALVSSLVPEIIRWQTPLAHMRRTAVRDVEFRGQQIREGDSVILWYISGNRDERAIDQPDEFVIDRARPREHLSFGFGIHRCLGNRLAEMQVRVLWEEILRRGERVEVVGDHERVSSCLFRAIQRLPVRIVA